MINRAAAWHAQILNSCEAASGKTLARIYSTKKPNQSESSRCRTNRQATARHPGSSRPPGAHQIILSRGRRSIWSPSGFRDPGRRFTHERFARFIQWQSARHDRRRLDGVQLPGVWTLCGVPVAPGGANCKFDRLRGRLFLRGTHFEVRAAHLARPRRRRGSRNSPRPPRRLHPAPVPPRRGRAALGDLRHPVRQFIAAPVRVPPYVRPAQKSPRGPRLVDVETQLERLYST